MELNNIYNTDALEGLKQLDENSIDAIISDPPYQLTSMTRGRPDQTEDGEYGREVPFSRVQSRIKGFMNKDWDVLPSVDILKECLRVLKTGAWALWLMTPRQDSQLEFLLRLRQAGFNISFSELSWIYLSGFPKAADLSLLADKRACREDLTQKLGREPTKEEFKEVWDKWRITTGYDKHRSKERNDYSKDNFEWENKDIPTSQEAQALSGSYAGMQLKPARELIIVSQKPIAEKTYLDQALLHLKEPEHNQLGGTWLDDGRIPYKQTDDIIAKNPHTASKGSEAYNTVIYGKYNPVQQPIDYTKEVGRFPANIIVSDNALDIGINKKSTKVDSIGGFGAGVNTFGAGLVNYERGYDDSGDLSRYFDLDFWFENKLKELPEEQQKIFPFLYVPKASKSERNKGLENLPETLSINGDKWTDMDRRENNKPTPRRNIHPTAKPIKLMSYLITLSTRENDIVLDPFTGSGTTAISSILLKRRFIGFEREEEYYKIATERIKYYQNKDAIQFQHSLLGSA